MKKSLTVRTAFYTLFTLVFSVCGAYSQERVAADLDEVTVYATRTAQPSFDTPAFVSKIMADSPAAALASGKAGLLKFVPGVEVGGGPRSSVQTVSVRGFDDAAIVTLIDGRRQNFEGQHDGRFFLDPALLKSVEIVRGASSAAYGGGAIGGVVAFETKDAADLLAPGQIFGAMSSFGYSSARSEYAPMFTAFAADDRWDLLGAVSYRNSGDIKQGDGNKLKTENEPLSLMFKASGSFFDFHTLKFQGQMLKNDGKWPNNGSRFVTRSNPVVNQSVRDNQFSLKYSFSNPANPWARPKLHIYRNETEVREEDISGGNEGRVQTRELDTTGLTLDNQTELLFGGSNRNFISYGFEIYKNEQKGARSTETGRKRPGVPDAESVVYGFYLQDEVFFNSPVGEFTALAAVRFDKYKNSDDGKNCSRTVGETTSSVACPKLNEGEWSPKFSLTYKPVKQAMIFGSWARAFRAPNLTEIYAAGVHYEIPRTPIRNMFVPSPEDLKPETVNTFELGAGLKFDRLLSADDRASIKGSWFYSKGDDFITQDIGTTTTRYLNISNAKINGFDIEGSYRFNPLSLKIGMHYVNAKDDDTGKYLSNNVPFTFVSDLSVLISRINSVIGLRARFAADNDRIGTDEIDPTPDRTGMIRLNQKTDGYQVFDLYYRWTHNAAEGRENLTVDLGLQNIFDKAYTKRFAYLLEEGRSFVGRVSYKW